MPAISNKIINRLTLYHCLLKYTFKEQRSISSFEIAELLDLDDSLVRKDIALCGVLGRKKGGYPINELQQAIEQKLGFAERKEVFIIGAGNLGTALVNYADFKDYGIDVLALFDNDSAKIGQEAGGKKILALDKLQNLIAKISIKNIILTVPPQAAQEVTDYAVKCGVQFIWNFTPVILKTPKAVTVYNENIVSSFLQMHNFI
ncbi:MAG: redox-sensing transcriptional repressor Rex [Alphaproteobacteria bacterium]|nr:redox-sensing transcriptional repressor Rex [Alphaproteobacteria bacterium]